MTAQKASLGHDPTIGGPAWVATQAGPFLTESSQSNDACPYKVGSSEHKGVYARLRGLCEPNMTEHSNFWFCED